MPGYSEFKTKEQVLENEIYELKRKMNSQNFEKEKRKKAQQAKEKLESVARLASESLPERNFRVYEVPKKEDDFRIYLSWGQYFKEKVNIFLTIDPTTHDFHISQKNVLVPEKMSDFVTTEINTENPVLTTMISVVREKYPQHASKLVKQLETKEFL